MTSPAVESMIANHERWLRSEGNEGAKADLEGADLSKHDLRGADLRYAHLRHVNFSFAKLGGAKFCQADLRQANFDGADLSGADFQGADLEDVSNLSRARLYGANFDTAKNLLGREFARSDLTRVKLPEEIGEFNTFQLVEEISENARKIFFAILLSCAYCWLTIITTGDVGLLTNSSTSPLPVIGTEILIGFFYWIAPVVLLTLYIYLHLYLQRLWEALSYLPARLTDGKRVDERVYPWLLNGLVRHHFPLLRVNRPIHSILEAWVTILLVWWLVPLTLIGLWWRYLWRHDWFGTIFHVLFLSGNIWVAFIQQRQAATILSGQRQTGQNRKRRENAIVIGVAIVAGIISAFAIINPFYLESGNGYYFYVDFKDADLSRKPNDWSGDETNKVKGARLSGANLNWADLENAFLVKAYMEKANLDYAQVKNADFRRANLKKASFQWANADFARFDNIRARRVKFKNADLEFSSFQNAFLHEAQLRGAYLNGANLGNADLTKADLSGAMVGCGVAEPQMEYLCANLNRADLRDAILADTCFQGADLSGTRGLGEAAQLCRAQTYFKAKLDPAIERVIKKECPQLLSEPEEDGCAGGEQKMPH